MEFNFQPEPQGPSFPDGLEPQTPHRGKAFEWLCAVLGVCGSLLVALNIAYSPYGWVLFALSALFGVCWGLRARLASMILMNGTFLAINLIGIWRHLLPLFAQAG